MSDSLNWRITYAAKWGALRREQAEAMEVYIERGVYNLEREEREDAQGTRIVRFPEIDAAVDRLCQRWQGNRKPDVSDILREIKQARKVGPGAFGGDRLANERQRLRATSDNLERWEIICSPKDIADCTELKRFAEMNCPNFEPPVFPKASEVMKARVGVVQNVSKENHWKTQRQALREWDRVRGCGSPGPSGARAMETKREVAFYDT